MILWKIENDTLVLGEGQSWNQTETNESPPWKSLAWHNVEVRNTIHPISMYQFFTHTIYSFTGFDKIDTSNVDTMNYCFGYIDYVSGDNADALVEIDMNTWDLSNVNDNERMFFGRQNLETIYAWSNDMRDISGITRGKDVFYGCTSLVGKYDGDFTANVPYDQNHTHSNYSCTAKEGGYFTLITKNVTASADGGTIAGAGRYDYMGEVSITVTPSADHFFDWLKEGNTVISSEDSLNPYTYTFNIDRDMDFTASCPVRDAHTLEVNSLYDVTGTGSYRYLDSVSLYADPNYEFLLQGWYLNGQLLGTESPVSFTMPNEDTIIDAVFEGTPYDASNVRQFWLVNGDNETLPLSKGDIFISNPSNMGFRKSITTTRYANAEVVSTETYQMPSPTGTLVFKEAVNSNRYRKYYDFVRFISKKPLTLFYKIPTSDIKNIYHIDCEVTEVTKSESKSDHLLQSTITFRGLGFWRYSQVSYGVATGEVDVENNGDMPTGCVITCSKGDSSAFANPVITFSQNGEDYGCCKLNGTFDRIIINTIEGQQDIHLELNGAVIPNPFAYIDFSAGGLAFPFPKLKQGETKVTFSYDSSGAESKNVSVVYSEEFLSV